MLQRSIDPFVGRALDGRYTVLEKIGQGGMGAIYRATQHSVDRDVAIKIVAASRAVGPDRIKRFLREARLASRLNHPNAVGVLDSGQSEDGTFYLVMELVSGRTLADVLQLEGVLRPERLVRIGIQICDALESAHRLSIIHRDLKPANVMVLATERDFVKVLDFGLAKSLSPDLALTTLTEAGEILGTPAFMSPELANGQPCDARSDLYSLGAMLYQLGSGELPFIADAPHLVMAMHASDVPVPPVKHLPPRLARVIDRLLRKNPAERYQTAGEARAALEGTLALSTPFSGAEIGDWPDDTKTDTRPLHVRAFGPFEPVSVTQPASQVAEADNAFLTPEPAPRAGVGAAGAKLASDPGISPIGLSPVVEPVPEPRPRFKRPLLLVGGLVVSVIAVAIGVRGGGTTAMTSTTAPSPKAPVPTAITPPGDNTAAPAPSVPASSIAPSSSKPSDPRDATSSSAAPSAAPATAEDPARA
ncbi:MAG: serine/threonine-protein kinase, partial [Kofleriaceae bacterium]